MLSLSVGNWVGVPNRPLLLSRLRCSAHIWSRPLTTYLEPESVAECETDLAVARKAVIPDRPSGHGDRSSLMASSRLAVLVRASSRL